VAFGGRTVRKEKTIAKYVNSPESDIYSKRRELYGIFQSKQAISREGKCIIVEGYMDVISMHQAGVCNVVASSGTALTIEQVRLIKRFTRKVTLIYDADAAGIKAALRGIELLLQEDFDIKVLLLPPGEDPDSFAQSHSSSEVEEYISANETDFITFMARILLAEKADDPTHRAAVITRVVKTIALIPNEITRSVYIQECSKLLFIAEDVLRREVGKYFNQYALKSREERERSEAAATLPPEADSPVTPQTPAHPAADSAIESAATVTARKLRPYELELMKLIARYGNYPFAEFIDEEGNTLPATVLEYIASDLESDSIELTNPDAALLLRTARKLNADGWEADLEHERERLLQVRAEEFSRGVDEIRAKAKDIGSITAMEHALNERIDLEFNTALEDFATDYLSRRMCSSPNDTVRNLATELVIEPYVLSKVHTKYAKVPTERDLLSELVPRALSELKDAIIYVRILDVNKRIKEAGNADITRLQPLMQELKELQEMRKKVSKLIGDRVIAPRK
ncbi:MAG: toprim domain-containing protein, partial [Duncaniella sp.]|nr:toprim domain-containing protein [Duncaniella sp.]